MRESETAGHTVKVLEKEKHFKAGLIDFTAGSLGKFLCHILFITSPRCFLQLLFFLWPKNLRISGGVALVYVSQPLDTVKVKMQTFPEIYKGMGDCLIETFKKDGIVRGLYAGTLPAIAANVAENSILFAGNRTHTNISTSNHVNSDTKCMLFLCTFLLIGYGACQKFIANIEGHKSVDELSSLR